MASEIKQPRIVCTACPAEAKVHRFELRLTDDSAIAWVECHGKHILAEIDGFILLRLRELGHDLPLQNITDISDQAPEMYRRCEERVEEIAQRMRWLDAFMRGRPL